MENYFDYWFSEMFGNEPDDSEVVHCKDCAYSSTSTAEETGKQSLCCNHFREPVMPEDFCSYGERGE